MSPLRLCILACALSGSTAFAVDAEFKDVVRAISDEFHVRPMRIPMFGLVKFATFVVRPAGATHINIAIFENIHWRDDDDRDMRTVIRRAVGRGWTPFVQVQSRRHGNEELVMVYMRPEGNNCRLLVTAIERDEATVVELKLNPDGLKRWVEMPYESALSKGGERRDRDNE